MSEHLTESLTGCSTVSPSWLYQRLYNCQKYHHCWGEGRAFPQDTSFESRWFGPLWVALVSWKLSCSAACFQVSKLCYFGLEFAMPSQVSTASLHALHTWKVIGKKERQAIPCVWSLGHSCSVDVRCHCKDGDLDCQPPILAPGNCWDAFMQLRRRLLDALSPSICVLSLPTCCFQSHRRKHLVSWQPITGHLSA